MSFDKDPKGRCPGILLVEDNELVRMTLAEALVDAGCLVIEAANASDAITIFREQQNEINVVVIDIGLPDGRGNELAAEFRAARPDLAVLLTTGYGDVRSKIDLVSNLRIRILEKPFDNWQLYEALRQLDVPLPRPPKPA